MARSWTFGKKIAAGFALSFVLLAAIGAWHIAASTHSREPALLGGAHARCPGAHRQRAQPAEGRRDRTARLHHHRR